MRILELGSYIVPAYAGMLLAEQGHFVEKWIWSSDPILDLRCGAELWAWINHGKQLVRRHAASMVTCGEDWNFDIVLDNFRPSTLAKWGIDPQKIATERECVWVSMRADLGEVSFDAIAQARGWLDTTPYVPFYAGDTIGGLWLAFKALSAREPGHYTVMQAAALAKLIEGELMVDLPRTMESVPWDTGLYRVTGGLAQVEHKGTLFEEPVRDREWKRKNLRHVGGRFVI
jgi:hypothetical protein